MRLYLDARQVAEATATGPGNSPYVNVDIDFTVPQAEQGSHEVTAVGADFTVQCRTPSGRRFEVLGESESQVLGAGEERGRGGVGAGSLPRTGVYVVALVAMALALLAAGRSLTAAGRQRRRRVLRLPDAPRRHISSHRSSGD